jgi:hypothetical protein
MGMLGRTRLIGVALAVLMVHAAPVSADDPDASKAPRVFGPLIGTPLDCEDDGPPGKGESKGQACGWSYELAPAESNLEEDFYANWIQIEIDPGPGAWCAKAIIFRMKTGADARIVSAVPDHSGEAPRSSVTEFEVDADGAAPVPGTISQDVLPARGKVSVSMDDRHYSYAWEGNSGHKVMVAIGVQLASPQPLDFSLEDSETIGMGMGLCHTLIIRATDRG